ncbi:ABC1 family-domain-containing protein [Phycomyces nitens]|nr:ABC1 family-domain-containing protein [Phycomyces nitens]
MALTRGLVDIFVLATATTKIGYSFLGSQSSALGHHLKTSSLLNPTATEPQAESSQIKETILYSPKDPIEIDAVLKESIQTESSITSHQTPLDTIPSPAPLNSTIEQAVNVEVTLKNTPAPEPEKLVEPVTTVLKENTAYFTQEPKKVLKEARIPTSRAGRMWHYGTLATGLGLGAISESVKRATGISSNNQGSVMLSEKNVDRLVEKLSRMRGAALKMGQMLSIQGIQAAGEGKSMIPPQLEQILLRVHDSANYMPKKQMEEVMAQELGADWRSKFSEFDPIPMAAASIGQVHAAKLASTGEDVVIKIQYPGVAQSIDSDLNNLKTIITFSNLLPRGLYLDNTVKVTKQELAWECDYLREADSAQRFNSLLQHDDRYKVPRVFKELCTKQILVSERLNGRVLSKATEEPQDIRNKLGEGILRLCLREVFSFQFMQTDPNWSNFFYNRRNGQLELLDFGACREFPDAFLALYGRILVSASRGDREGVWQYSKELGFVTGYETEIMRNAHIDSVMVLGEPFRENAPDVYDFEKQTITERVRETIPVMLRHRLTPPPDETYGLHKKLSGAFLLCTKLGSKFDTKAVWKDEVNASFRAFKSNDEN